MPGEMRFNEYEVSNILGTLNNVCATLQNAANSLNGIDAEASSLGVSNLNVSQVQQNISANKGKINNIIQCINNILNELTNAEQKNVGIVGIFGRIKGALNGLKNTFSTIAFLNNVNSDGEYKVKITGKGAVLWKDGVEYTIAIEEINAGNIGKLRCFILEPENADHNIPTVLCLDGDGASAVSGLDTNAVKGAIESVDGGKRLYGEIRKSRWI